MATHFKGPLLGSLDAGGGLFKDLPLGEIDRVRSNYETWVEPFSEEFATGQAILMGAHIDDLNTATSPTQLVTTETGYLLINPGTKADAGSSMVFDLRPVATGLGHTSFQTPGAISSTTTLMDGRELIWACRFALATDDVTTGAWDGKVLMGWFAADTTPMVDATGVPSVATGGGAGFHIGEGGVITFVGSQTAITAAGSRTILNINTSETAGASITTINSASAWHEAGFRIKWVDASAGTGKIDYFFDGRWVGAITSDLPMASTQVYASTFAIQNGPAQVSDIALDYLVTAISGLGR